MVEARALGHLEKVRGRGSLAGSTEFLSIVSLDQALAPLSIDHTGNSLFCAGKKLHLRGQSMQTVSPHSG